MSWKTKLKPIGIPPMLIIACSSWVTSSLFLPCQMTKQDQSLHGSTSGVTMHSMPREKHNNIGHNWEGSVEQI